MELDSTDEGTPYLLQRDARCLITREMGERTGVSASTVRNRIDVARINDELGLGVVNAEIIDDTVLQSFSHSGRRPVDGGTLA